MKYSSKITVELDNTRELLEIFEPELKTNINDRASYTIKEKKGELIFDISAADSVSLRSVLNSITKLLTVYEKLN